MIGQRKQGLLGRGKIIVALDFQQGITPRPASASQLRQVI